MTTGDTLLNIGVLASLGIWVISVCWILWLTITAPDGYQDSEGWHEGHPDEFGDAARMPEAHRKRNSRVH